MKKLAAICIITFSFVHLYDVSAQTDSSKVADSVNAVLLDDFNSKIAKIDLLRTEDSLKKVQLKEELLNLKTTDNVKKEELLDELKVLNSQESKRLAEKKARIDSLRQSAKSYPVIGFFEDTLFLIYNKSGSFTAEERASAIETRIRKIGERFSLKKDSLQVVVSETTVDVVYGADIVVSVSENDALWNDKTKQALAEQYLEIISRAIENYNEETSLITLLKEFGMALLVLLVLGLIIFYCNRLFRWTAVKIASQENKLLSGLKLGDYTLLDAHKQVRFVTTLNKLLKWLVILLLVYTALPILFGIFPWTQNFAETLINYIFDPLKAIWLAFWDYLPNLFTILVIFMVFRYIIKGAGFLKSEIASGNLKIPEFYPDWANPTYSIVKILLYAFMFVLIFPYLPGSDSPVFQGVSVFLGFLLTFGSAGSLSNVIAGLVLTYMRLFFKGDRVKIGEVTGDVIERSLLVTRVRTIKNEIISIPNSTVMNSHTINYSSDSPSNGLILHTTVTIGYDVPWKKMHEALINAANRTDLLLKEPKPFVLQTSLEDFYVSYQINAYTKSPNKQSIIYSELHQNIQDCCNEVGIEILSPHYRAARDGNMSTIPESYHSKDYKAPSFNVKMEKNESEPN